VDQSTPPAVQPVPTRPLSKMGEAPATCAGCEMAQTATAVARLLGVDLAVLPLCTMCAVSHRLREDIAAQMILQRCSPETRVHLQRWRARRPAMSDADLLAACLTAICRTP